MLIALPMCQLLIGLHGRSLLGRACALHFAAVPPGPLVRTMMTGASCHFALHLHCYVSHRAEILFVPMTLSKNAKVKIKGCMF